MQKRFLFIFLFIAVAVAAMAQQPSFALVQPRNVIEGRNFRLTFRLSDGEANPPAAPELDGCTLLYGPATSTMQSTQIINGRMTSSSSIDYSFTYRADKAGSVSVPEVAVQCGGKTLKSRAASFQILPPDRNSSPQGAGNNRQPDDVTPSGTPAQISADDLLVRVFFSKNSVYEQEPVVATIKVYTKYDISSFMVTTQPVFEGFLTEELPVDLETSIEHYNGQNYHTAVLKRLLLYPQKAGTLSVNSGKYDVTIVQYEQVNMGFFGTASRPIERNVTTSSNAATLSVKALPQPQPDGFCGAVGSFSVHTSLEPELMRTNEASTYSYIIKGSGNIKFLTPPTVEFPAGIDTYTPKTDISANLIGGGTNMSGTFRTDYTIVPQEVGNFVIKGVPFVYFDIESGTYKTVDVDDMPIKVLRGNGSAPAPSQITLDETIDDILHIRRTDSERQAAEIHYTFRSPMYWFLYILAVLILAGVLVVYRRNIRLEADVAGRKLAKAGRVATKRLKESKAYLDAHKNDMFYAALAKALWGYISDKLSIAPSQLTRDNVAEKLSAYGLDKNATDEVLDVLDRCEMARFTPNDSETEASDIYSKAERAIKSIEDVKK